MAKYRKKPVVIEAVQWTGKNTNEILEFIGKDGFYSDFNKEANYSTTPRIGVSTLEGEISASVGDFIIKGVQGEFYPCKPDIFEQTYEKVDVDG